MCDFNSRKLISGQVVRNVVVKAGSLYPASTSIFVTLVLS